MIAANEFIVGPHKEDLNAAWTYNYQEMHSLRSIGALVDAVADSVPVAVQGTAACVNDAASRCAGAFVLRIHDSVAVRVSRQSGSHDPLGAPAVVEDICSAFRTERGVDLLPSYLENTRPCVVGFIEGETRPEYLGAALHYLYRHLRGGPLPGDCRVGFDAGGEAIPPERIRKVEFLASIAALCPLSPGTLTSGPCVGDDRLRRRACFSKGGG